MTSYVCYRRRHTTKKTNRPENDGMIHATMTTNLDPRYTSSSPSSLSSSLVVVVTPSNFWRLRFDDAPRVKVIFFEEKRREEPPYRRRRCSVSVSAITHHRHRLTAFNSLLTKFLPQFCFRRYYVYYPLDSKRIRYRRCDACARITAEVSNPCDEEQQQQRQQQQQQQQPTDPCAI